MLLSELMPEVQCSDFVKEVFCFQIVEVRARLLVVLEELSSIAMARVRG